ncbi:MAG TPA: transcription termination/antitermination NusG family protein [Verrucomicrobiales bacterium]|nr:transcription termination/antitermination NusG family protein [Verrucomicrobiales bacterium]
MPLPSQNEPEQPAWYCLRTRAKCEHIAAAHLRLLPEIDVFCPRISFHKATARGKVLFRRAMFPSYLFARFLLGEQRRAVTHSHAVSGIVGFGDDYPPVPEAHIEFLRSEIGPGEIALVQHSLNSGDEILIAEGPMRGLRAIVRCYLPAKERIQVLMHMLGRENLVELPEHIVVPVTGSD